MKHSIIIILLLAGGIISSGCATFGMQFGAGAEYAPINASTPGMEIKPLQSPVEENLDFVQFNYRFLGFELLSGTDAFPTSQQVEAVSYHGSPLYGPSSKTQYLGIQQTDLMLKVYSPFHPSWCNVYLGGGNDYPGVYYLAKNGSQIANSGEDDYLVATEAGVDFSLVRSPYCALLFTLAVQGCWGVFVVNTLDGPLKLSAPYNATADLTFRWGDEGY